MGSGKRKKAETDEGPPGLSGIPADTCEKLPSILIFGEPSVSNIQIQEHFIHSDPFHPAGNITGTSLFRLQGPLLHEAILRALSLNTQPRVWEDRTKWRLANRIEPLTTVYGPTKYDGGVDALKNNGGTGRSKLLGWFDERSLLYDSYAISAQPRTTADRRERSWRITGSRHVSHPETLSGYTHGDIPNEYSANLLLIDSSCLTTGLASSIPELVAKNLKKPGIVLIKVENRSNSGPIGSDVVRDLNNHILDLLGKSDLAHRTLIMVTAQDLRLQDYSISKFLSWERTVQTAIESLKIIQEELRTSLATGQRGLSTRHFLFLGKARHIAVSISPDAVLYIHCDEAGKVLSTDIFAHPGEVEEEMFGRSSGRTRGYDTIVLCSIAHHLALATETASKTDSLATTQYRDALRLGIERGLHAARFTHLHGYSDVEQSSLSHILSLSPLSKHSEVGPVLDIEQPFLAHSQSRAPLHYPVDSIAAIINSGTIDAATWSPSSLMPLATIVCDQLIPLALELCAEDSWNDRYPNIDRYEACFFAGCAILSLSKGALPKGGRLLSLIRNRFGTLGPNHELVQSSQRSESDPKPDPTYLKAVGELIQRLLLLDGGEDSQERLLAVSEALKGELQRFTRTQAAKEAYALLLEQFEDRLSRASTQGQTASWFNAGFEATKEHFDAVEEHRKTRSYPKKYTEALFVYAKGRLQQLEQSMRSNLLEDIKSMCNRLRLDYEDSSGIRRMSVSPRVLTAIQSRLTESIAINQKSTPILKSAHFDSTWWSFLGEHITAGETSVGDQPTEQMLTIAEEHIRSSGAESRRIGIPYAQFGNFFTLSRSEIEAVRDLVSLIRTYVQLVSDPNVNVSRPLNLAVFGPPGAGKSYAVTALVKSLSSNKISASPKIFNLSQAKSPADLSEALHAVRDVGLTGKIPLVFWDEYDSTFQGEEFGWLRYFLAPMWDGQFQEGQQIHPIGPAIFVFAGSRFTSQLSLETAMVLDQEGLLDSSDCPSELTLFDGFKAAKGMDFKSRLLGSLDISDVNAREGLPHVLKYARLQLERKSTSDRTGEPLRSDSGLGRDLDPGWKLYYIFKRAILIKSEINRFFPGLEEYSPSVLQAFLQTRRYHHGARSLSALIQMSDLARVRFFDASALPGDNQLRLHVDPADFESFFRHAHYRNI